MLFLLLLFLLLLFGLDGAGSALADSVQHGGIRFDLPSAEAEAGDSSSGSSDASAGDAYGSCFWGRPCRPPAGASCPAIGYGKPNVTEKECHEACAADGVDVQNQSSRNGTCGWRRYADGKRRQEAPHSKRASCHLHIPRDNGPAEGSVASPRSFEECEADCERKKLFELVGARCEWRSAEGEKVRIK